MIDVTKPLELEDGTPVKYHRDSTRYAGFIMVGIEGVNGSKAFNRNNGLHLYAEYQNLRNVVMKLVDVNKPVTVGGKEAKIVHQFDNGNLAVVVDGWSEVQNYNQYGQANGEGCVVLRNLAEQTVRFLTLWNDTANIVGSVYKSKEDAEDRRGNAPDRYAGTLKLTLVDGIATWAEIV